MSKPGKVLNRIELLQGTLDLIVLQTLLWGPRHGYGIAQMIRAIERAYPKAKTIHLVMDNLSSHTVRPLKESFGEDEGSRIWSRFTVHYTPKHGSWLNQAECELSIYARQCLGKRRIASLPELRAQTAAWNRRANRNKLTIDWKFGVRQARKKFKYTGLKTSRSEH